MCTYRYVTLHTVYTLSVRFDTKVSLVCRCCLYLYWCVLTAYFTLHSTGEYDPLILDFLGGEQ